MSNPQDGPRTQVSRQEELMYGAYAPVVRRLGRAAEEADAAYRELEQLLKGSQEADALTAGVVDPQVKLDREGRSPHTLWLLDLGERLSALRSTSITLLAQGGFEAIQQENLTRGVTLELVVGGRDALV